MRVLLSCLQSEKEHPLPPYKYWERYFRGGISEMGSAVIAAEGVDWAEGLLYEHDAVAASAWRDQTWSRVLASIDRARGTDRPDVFLSYLYPWMVDASAVREIQRRGVPCVNFYCDNVREFIRAPTEYGVFDLNWVPELAATRFYEDAGMPYIHAPMPAWVPPELRTAEHPEIHGASFIGSRDSQREVLFAEAIALGASVELRGPGWPAMTSRPARAGPNATRPDRSLWRMVRNNLHFVRRFGAIGLARKIQERLRQPVSDATFISRARPPAFGEDYVRITQTSRIIIGVNRYPTYRHPFHKPDTYSRARDIEAPMMGACYLTEWTPELPLLYDIGREVETYRDASELFGRLRDLEADQVRRRAMRRAAQARALADHSVPRSLQRIGERLGLMGRSVA